MTEILEFINNTDTVDINDPASIVLIGWEPSLPGRRETTHFPIYDNGSSLLSRQFENTVETFTLAIVGTNQNSVATNLRNLVSILEAGVSYHIGLKTTPTYLRAKANNETNTRYAIVKNYRLEKIPQVMGSSPFNTGIISYGTVYPAGLVQITLVVELQIWQSQPPGSYDTVLSSNYYEHDGFYFGTVDESGVSVPITSTYVAGKFNDANITQLVRFDSSAGTYSAINVFPPFNLFPSPIGSGDILYMSSVLSDPTPFNSAIFDIQTNASPGMTIAVEYWTGAAWTSVTGLDDETNGFGRTGIRRMSWVPSSNWASNNPGMGITAYWIRIRITNLNGNSNVPTQRNRRVYTVTWPYLEIEADQVTGDIPPILKLKIESQSLGSGGTGELLGMIIGLRSTSRGEDFYPIWNASDAQNFPGVSFSGNTMTNSTVHPAGRIANETTVSDSDTSLGTWTLDADYTTEYKGRFRVLVAIDQGSTSGSPSEEDISYYLFVKTPTAISGTRFATERRSPYVLTSTNFMCIDMGELSILDNVESGELISEDLTIELFGKCSTGMTANQRPVWIALVPVDEWSCEVSSVHAAAEYIIDLDSYYMDLDGTRKKASVSTSRDSTSTAVVRVPPYNGVQLPFLQANSQQRLWFFPLTVSRTVDHNVLLKVTVQAVRRYLTIRGSD